MEPVILHSDRSISSPYKHLRNPRENNRPLVSRFPDNFHGRLLYAPAPSLSYPSPHSISLLNPHQHTPLLPLPISRRNSRSRSLSRPPINRKINNRTREQSLTPKKSKSSISPKKEFTIARPISSECLVASANKRLAPPDAMDLPKNVSRVLSSSSSDNDNNMEFSGSMFTLSPPPSSLPLPNFSLRSKLSCKVEAAGIDARATDSLRRLLKLG